MTTVRSTMVRESTSMALPIDAVRQSRVSTEEIVGRSKTHRRERHMSTTLRQTISESAENYFRHASQGVTRVNLEDAACRHEDLEMFFAVGDGREENAKAVCQRCPVRWECLTYALETRQRHGVWGGLTAEERVLLIRKIRSDLSR